MHSISSYHKDVFQYLLHNISSWFDDNRKSQSQLDGKKQPNNSVEPVPGEIGEDVP